MSASRDIDWYRSRDVFYLLLCKRFYIVWSICMRCCSKSRTSSVFLQNSEWRRSCNKYVLIFLTLLLSHFLKKRKNFDRAQSERFLSVRVHVKDVCLFRRAFNEMCLMSVADACAALAMLHQQCRRDKSLRFYTLNRTELFCTLQAHIGHVLLHNWFLFFVRFAILYRNVRVSVEFDETCASHAQWIMVHSCSCNQRKIDYSRYSQLKLMFFTCVPSCF